MTAVAEDWTHYLTRACDSQREQIELANAKVWRELSRKALRELRP